MKYLLILPGLLAAQAHAASFDCTKAAAPDEHTVCADPQLSLLDDLVARAFGQAKQASSSPDQQRNVQAYARTFLKDRRACQADRSCIFGSYVGVWVSYQNLGAKDAMPSWISAPAIAGNRPAVNGPLPTRIGQCSMTGVTEITPRLDPGHSPASQDFDSGTAINYRNAGHQVSYDREPALLNSKPGDSVVMCLVAVLHDCPTGDDRGRVYTVTNVRTAATWTLPDSQHSCGGA
jgi:uncharacterized protein